MTLVLLPCEIYHREFDSKLLLSCCLASEYNKSCLIGYDKYFPLFADKLPPSLILDKSCSSLIWQNRVQKIIDNGGSAVISDEEGFNNISADSPQLWLNRVDLKCASSLDLYASWGEIDHNFFAQIPELQPKMKILGNIRSDLLGIKGANYYSQTISALNNLFDSFILCTDNFVCEHRYGSSFRPPAFDTSDTNNRKADAEFDTSQQLLLMRRHFFAKMIYKLASENPTQNYIIRPHPCSDDRWWNNYFWWLRNVHIIYHDNIEPYLHAASCLISMGCTSALQAIIAGTPVIEIKSSLGDRDLSLPLNGYADKFTNLHATNFDQLSECLNLALAKPDTCFNNLDYLSTLWHDCFTPTVTSSMAAAIIDLIPSWNVESKSKFNKTMNSLSSYIKKSQFKVDQTKWIVPKTSTIKSKMVSIQESFSFQNLRIVEVAPCLYFIARV